MCGAYAFLISTCEIRPNDGLLAGEGCALVRGLGVFVNLGWGGVGRVRAVGAIGPPVARDGSRHGT